MSNQLTVSQTLNERAQVSVQFAGNVAQFGGCLGGTFSSLEKHEDADINELLRDHALKLADIEVRARAVRAAMEQVRQQRDSNGLPDV